MWQWHGRGGIMSTYFPDENHKDSRTKTKTKKEEISPTQADPSTDYPSTDRK
jgi:hypothetical protein